MSDSNNMITYRLFLDSDFIPFTDKEGVPVEFLCHSASKYVMDLLADLREFQVNWKIVSSEGEEWIYEFDSATNCMLRVDFIEKKKIYLTFGELHQRFGMDKEVCHIMGINPWCLNEGLSVRSDILEVSEKQAEKLGISKWEFESRLK